MHIHDIQSHIHFWCSLIILLIFYYLLNILKLLKLASSLKYPSSLIFFHFSLLILLIFKFLCMYTCMYTCVCVCVFMHVQVPAESRKENQITWSQGYKQLWGFCIARNWILEIKFWSFAQGTNALNCWHIFLAHLYFQYSFLLIIFKENWQSILSNSQYIKSLCQIFESFRYVNRIICYNYYVHIKDSVGRIQ